MLLVDSLAEEHIRAAIRRGEFDDLPGLGRPLILEDDSAVPAELRVGYRILRNSGYLPPELALRKEISELESLLHRVEMDVEHHAIRRRLHLLQARLAMQGHDASQLLRELAYREKVIARLARCDNSNTGANQTQTPIAATAVT